MSIKIQYLGRNTLKIDSKSFIDRHANDLKFAIEDSFARDKVNRLAKQSGFMSRNRKLSATQLVNTLMFSSCNQAHTSLEDMAADLHQQFDIDISKEALHKKFTQQGVQFLKELLQVQISKQFSSQIDPALCTHFSAIKLKDSCRFSIPTTYHGSYPGFGNFSLKNGVVQWQYEYDLLRGNWEYLELTSIRKNDQKNSNETLDLITKASLNIRDLGYITPNYLQAVVKQDAFFLNRIPPQASIYNPVSKKQITWKDLHRKFNKTKAATLELNVLLYEKHLIPCRLIIEKLNDEGYRKRLKKAQNSAKSRGVGLSDDHRIRCCYNTFITNVGKKNLPAVKIRKAYYLRWQIELVFKTWKSFFEIDRVKKVKKERLECQLFSQLLWILVNWQLFNACNQYLKENNHKQRTSLLKFFKRCLSFSFSLRWVILNPDSIDHWLEQVFLPAIYNTACEAPRGKITHYQAISEIFTP